MIAQRICRKLFVRKKNRWRFAGGWNQEHIFKVKRQQIFLTDFASTRFLLYSNAKVLNRVQSKMYKNLKKKNKHICTYARNRFDRFFIVNQREKYNFSMLLSHL